MPAGTQHANTHDGQTLTISSFDDGSCFIYTSILIGKPHTLRFETATGIPVKFRQIKNLSDCHVSSSVFARTLRFWPTWFVITMKTVVLYHSVRCTYCMENFIFVYRTLGILMVFISYVPIFNNLEPTWKKRNLNSMPGAQKELATPLFSIQTLF